MVDAISSASAGSFTRRHGDHFSGHHFHRRGFVIHGLFEEQAQLRLTSIEVIFENCRSARRRQLLRSTVG